MVEKKTQWLTLEIKRELIEVDSDKLTIARQCQLLDLARSTFYYEPYVDDSQNLILMRQIDEIYTMHPYYGSRRIAWVLGTKGYKVGRDRVVSLMKRMGIQAIYAKPGLSCPQVGHKIYPYLLRGEKINHRDHVWSMDITYIRMKNGYLYLTAIMDWFCRYILSWKLSNSLEGIFCKEALVEALKVGNPLIFNTDQGSQFMSEDFTTILKSKGIKISMDGRGRALDNVFIERFWRSLKQEEVYITDYDDGLEANQRIGQYIQFYNNERPHMSLKYTTPAKVYFS